MNYQALSNDALLMGQPRYRASRKLILPTGVVTTSIAASS